MRIVFFLLVVAVLIACEEKKDEIYPTACFTFSPDTGIKMGDTIKFINCSENNISFVWDFGDGTTSIDSTPTHVYEKNGRYLVVLSAKNENLVDTVSKYIQVNENRPKAYFTFLPDSIGIGDSLKLTNCSENASSYLWDFGDGSTSAEKAPLHTYTKSGLYKIKLSATNKYYTDTVSKIVNVIDQYYTDLSYKLDVMCQGFVQKDIDFDKDSIIDVSVIAYSHFGTMSGHFDYIQLLLKNNYEISVTTGIKVQYDQNLFGEKSNYKYDTTLIPKEYKINNKISINANYSDTSIYLFYSKSGPYYISMGGGTYINVGSNWTSSDWSTSNYSYLTFRKKAENGYILAWLKVIANKNNIDIIYLKGCRYYKNQDEFIIDE
jgi:PKD repeat protein